MQHQRFYLSLLPMITLTACGTGRSADVKQNTIEQSYELTYHEATSQLKASASFHYENKLGTSLKLTDGSSIALNDTPMEYTNPLNMASYTLDMQMLRPPVTPMEFRYVNNDGEVFITPAQVPSPTVIKLPHDGAVVPFDRELAVQLQGDPISGGDELTLCLTYQPAVVSTTEPKVQECLHTTGSLRLVFSREQLARFPRGQALTLDIKRESHPRQENPRIRLAETFLSKPYLITVQE